MDRKIILFLLLGLFLISFASASSPNLIDGTQGLPSLDTAPLSNNTYNVNYSVVLTNSSYVTYANWNATNTSYFDLNKANTAGAFNQTFDTNTFFIDAVSNRVGIGTTSPAVKLHISSSGTTRLAVDTTEPTTSSFGSIVASASTNSTYLTWKNGGTLRIGHAPDIEGSNFASRMVIDSSGNVGIGTQTPQNLLNVVGDVNLTSNRLDLSSSSSANQYITKGSTSNSALIRFFTGTTGDWFIGTRETGTGNDFSIYNYGTGTDVVNIQRSTGNVGIGTTTPSDKLTVVGDINVSGCFELSNGTIIGGSCVSDIDTKKNLQNYSVDLNELLSLSPKKFEYKNTSILAGVEEYQECEENKFDENGTLIEEGKCLNKTQNVYYDFPEGVQIGFIAEEVELYYPEWITLDKFGFKRITYGMNWIFELWKQNQEQQKEINMLKKELCLKDNTYSWCIK